MNYQVRIQKRKDFQILENNMPIIKGAKPKWYSSEIVFFFNNKKTKIPIAIKNCCSFSIPIFFTL